MENFTTALWATDLSAPLASMGDWVALLRQKAADAKQQGAHVLLLPEYACIHWLAFAEGVAPLNYLDWLAEQTNEGIKAAQMVAKDIGLAIIPGTFPVLAGDSAKPLCQQPNDTRQDSAAKRYFNRAFVIGPDGSIVATQDKLVLTPWEMDERSWNIQPAAALNTFDIAGVTCALLVCLDIEQPTVAPYLFSKNIDVLLVPSMTMHPSGYNRVFICARARAIEGFVGVAVVGAVGEPACLVGKETNYCGAGVYVPCEMDIADNGIVAEIAAGYGMAGQAGQMLVADIPVGKIRQKKSGQTKPEAWPDIVTIK